MEEQDWRRAQQLQVVELPGSAGAGELPDTDGEATLGFVARPVLAAAKSEAVRLNEGAWRALATGTDLQATWAAARTDAFPVS